MPPYSELFFRGDYVHRGPGGVDLYPRAAGENAFTGVRPVIRSHLYFARMSRRGERALPQGTLPAPHISDAIYFPTAFVPMKDANATAAQGSEEGKRRSVVWK